MKSKRVKLVNPGEELIFVGNPSRTRRRTRKKASNPKGRRPVAGATAYTYSPQTRSRVYYKPHRKRRRNPATVRKAELNEALRTGLATGVGMVAVRSLANVVLKNQTGYMKAAGDAGIGIAAGIAAGSLKMDPRIQAGLMAGGVTSATIRIIDLLTAGRFQGIVTVGDYAAAPSVRQANSVVGSYYRKLKPLSGYVAGGMSGVQDNIPVGDPFQSRFASRF